MEVTVMWPDEASIGQLMLVSHGDQWGDLMKRTNIGLLMLVSRGGHSDEASKQALDS